MIAGMLFANVLSPAMREHVMSKISLKPVPCRPDLGPVLTSTRSDFEAMKGAIEELKPLEEKALTQNMDVP